MVLVQLCVIAVNTIEYVVLNSKKDVLLILKCYADNFGELIVITFEVNRI